MKTLLNRTLATVVLTGASAAAIAVPATHIGQAGYSNQGNLETSPRYQVIEDTYFSENEQGLFQPSPGLQYKEDFSDPLVTLPELTWAAE